LTVKLEHPIREYIKLAEKHNCKIIERTVNGYMLRLPVFISLEDTEAMKKEIELKRILIELNE
jgi:archaellum biogenesis ATPase FlaH